MARSTLLGATTAEKLALNVVRDGGCLRWTGVHNWRGYGQLGRRGAHRAAYELHIGPIPPGLEIDHVYARGCRFRDCVDPRHLEAVTHQENVLRSRAEARGQFVGKDTCIRGHPREPGATGKQGACKACAARSLECPICHKTFRSNNISRHAKRRHSLGPFGVGGLNVAS